ncbi:phospholipase-like protein [Tanacetum coccineum]
MDSFRYDGNVIHIIGGDDKPVSVTGNEYDTASGGATSDLSYGGNAVDADRSIAIQKMLFKTKMCVELGSGTCQNATNCNFAHSIAELRSPPTVTIKAKIDVVKEICEALTPTQFEIFEKTCFGHWLNVGLKKNSQLLIHTVLACMVDGKENELSFLILGDVIDIFDKMRKRTLVLEDNDAVRICLLVLLQQGFLGHQLSHNVSDDMLKLVEHLSNLRRYGGALVNPPNQSFNVPNSVAAPVSSFAVAGGAGQLQGAEQRSGQTTWKLPKKINGIYGDWIDAIQ